MGARQFVRLLVGSNPESQTQTQTQTQSDKRPTRKRARRFQTDTPLATAGNQRKGAAG